MAFRAGPINIRPPSGRSSGIRAMPAPPGAARQQPPMMRPPRIRAIHTRDYAKPEIASENPLQFSGAGFGSTGFDQ